MNDKEKILLKFGNHLKKLREEKGISIRELASSSALEYSQVQRIEKGKVNFAFSTLIALSEGLDLHISELLSGLKI